MEMNLIKKISEDIFEKGGRAFIVGGMVRDSLLGLDNKDIDLEIHCLSEKNLIKVLSKYGEVNKLGAKFGIYQIKGYDIDFALPRTETKTGEKHTDFEVSINPYLGIRKAMMRRDFTFNSLYKDVLSDAILDNFNGENDLNNKIIKHINTDTFIEDSLRVLRACQFSARFNFKIAYETMELCKNIDLTDISVERVFTELEKAIIKGIKPSLFFINLKAMGKLSPFFNELEKLSDNVFIELMNMIDNLQVKTVENVLTLIGFFIGELNYEKFVSRFSNQKTLIKPIIQKIQALTDFEPNEISFRRFCYRTQKCKENIFELNKVIGLCENFEEAYEKFLMDVKTPIITSADLFEVGGIPNNKFGILLKNAMNCQINGMTDKKAILNHIIKA